MSLFHNLLGNVSEVPPETAQREFQPILLDGETVSKAYKLFRDMIVMTNFRIISLDKQGVTGTKQHVTSIPYRNIKKFSKESAGIFDMDAELYVWLAGDAEPIKWGFAKGVNINEVYVLLSYYVLTAAH